MGSSDPDLVTVPRALLEQLIERVDALERRDAPPAPPSSSPGVAEPVDGKVGRRRALVGLAGAAGAATAGALLSGAEPAAATTGQPVILGYENGANDRTKVVSTSGTSFEAFSGTSNALLGTSNSGNGVYGISGTGVGVRAEGAIALHASGSRPIVAVSKEHAADRPAVEANHPGGTGITSVGKTIGVAATGKVAADLAGSETHLRLSNNNGFRGLPRDDTVAHQVGDILTDGYGNLWYCNTSGTPGTWRSVSGPTCAGAFYPWTAPIRAYDSRPGTNPTNPGPKTKLTANSTRTINLRTSGAASQNTVAVLVQVLLVNAAAGNGNFTIWAGGVAKPLANTLVWGGSSGRFSTLAFTNLDSTGNVQVNASLGTDLVLDVIGIYG